MFTLPKLTYSYKALEPFIDEQTMKIHHTKHHQAYIDKLNEALKNYPDLQKMQINELLTNINDVPDEIKQAVINHGGGHANHSDFWQNLCPANECKPPQGNLKNSIDETFGSVDNFKDEFNKKALALFGSGWVFLIKTNSGKLELKRHSFQNSPVLHGNTPLLGIDVWEHAYYLKYQNRRADYIEAFWNIVNWKKVEERFQKSAS